MEATVGNVTSGHKNDRRVIWDVLQEGDAGGGKTLYHLSAFTPVFPGAQIGGAKSGYGHYHQRMYETYIILAGECIMSLREVGSSDTTQYAIRVEKGSAPIKVVIPPLTVHRLIAVTETTLLIAATGPQSPDDTFELELANP